MVGSISSTNNLIRILSFNIERTNPGPQSPQSSGQAPRPEGDKTDNRLPQPPIGPSAPDGPGSRDPLGLFPAVDQNTDHALSESEYLVLHEGIQNVTGKEITGDFNDYDTDGDGVLSGAELKAVLDQAGFAPPSSPPSQGIAAYESHNKASDESGSLQDLLDYLRSGSKNFNTQA